MVISLLTFLCGGSCFLHLTNSSPILDMGAINRMHLGFIFRSINLTAHLSKSMDSSVYGYSGFFFQEFLTKDMPINPWRASSTHYHASAFSYIMYCNCNRRKSSHHFILVRKSPSKPCISNKNLEFMMKMTTASHIYSSLLN
jgi:hypothetical protein